MNLWNFDEVVELTGELLTGVDEEVKVAFDGGERARGTNRQEQK